MKLVFPMVFLGLVGFCQAQKLQNSGTHCRLLTFIPFTDEREGMTFPHNVSDPDYLRYGFGSWPNEETLGKAAYSLMASAEMARRHFNDRDPSIVPELAEDFMSQCDITIPDSSVYWDSAYSRATVVDELLDEWSESIRADDEDFFCGIVGPVEPRANEGASVLSETYGIPQFAYATIDRRLSRTTDFPNFRRIIPRGEDFASTIASYIQRDIWRRDYLGIIYEATDYGELFEDPLEDSEDLLEFESITEHVIIGNNESIHDSLGDASSRGYRTIILVIDRLAFLNDVAMVAEDLKMLDGDYFWVITGDAFPPAMTPYLKYEKDSPGDKLLRGAALVTHYDRFIYEGESNVFLKEWRKQSSVLVEQLNKKQPVRDDGSMHYSGESTYFQNQDPTEHASFIYDAVITAGISACKAKSDRNNDHMHHVLRTEFNGASGPLTFYDEKTGDYETSRNAEGVLYGVYNIRTGTSDDTNMRGYEKVLTSLYSQDHSFEFQKSDGTVWSGKGAWKKIEGSEFLFFDGSAQQPFPTLQVANAHFLSKNVQVLGFTLATISLAVSIASALWIFVYRKERIVKASQPEFIYALCFGACLVGSSVFFVSFDEEKVDSIERLSSMCVAFPWFFVPGYLTMYCALFSKLWRLSKLMQLRRRIVNVKQVLLPFSIIIACSAIVLVIWTVVDPLSWEITVIAEEPRETYGECRSEHILYFLVPLFSLFFLALAMTCFIAWRMKDIQSELSESKWIFFGIVLHLQIWAIGLPVVNIVDETSKDAEYLMYAVLTFIFSTSLVALVVGPKVYVWVLERWFGGKNKTGPKLSVMEGASTRVSGLAEQPQFRNGERPPSSSGVSVDRLRIEELEKEVETLQQQLREA